MSIQIRNVEFKEKFTEINIRQRMYQEKQYITLLITTEFYPTLVNEQIVSGTVEAKIDMENVHCINDFVGKKLEGDIGNVMLSVYNDGIWEHQSQEQFQFEIKSRNGRELEFLLTMEDGILETKGTLVSLYSTSSSKEELAETFDLGDFYESFVEKKFGSKKIVKYFVKE